jgi:DNA-binding transcriptional LysR family regulator
MYARCMNTTLDAWEILQTVVELGGFAPAAQKLHRSQSTISYAIARLQDQLGVQLFEPHGRKAQLTEAGRVLLAYAEPHLAGFHHIEQRARQMASGGPSEIRLSVDSLFPDVRLFDAMAAFSRTFPLVRPMLYQGVLISADTEFTVRESQLCVTGLISRETASRPILVVRLVAVARHDHELFMKARTLTSADLIDHMMVAIESSASGALKQQPRLPAQRALPVSTIETAISAVRSGICFGWLPKYRIQPEIDRGEFVELPLSIGQTREVRLNLVCKDSSFANTEVSTLAKLLGIHGNPEMI